MERMFGERLLGEASVRELRLALVVATTELEAECVSSVDAAALVEDFARLEAIAHGGLVLVAERAAASGVWRAGGHRSAAHWLASVAGVTLGLAQRILGTSGRMASQPRTREAARRGDLPRDTVHDVSEAAEADPGAEDELVDTAQRDSVRSTRDRCKQTKANALSDAQRARQARRNRFVRRRSHPDGSAGFEYQAPGVDAAEVLAAIEHFQREIFERARRAGERTDSFENHAADALLAIARAAMAPPEPPAPPAPPAPPDEAGEAASPDEAGAGGNRRARRTRARRGEQRGGRVARPTVLVRVDHTALSQPCTEQRLCIQASALRWWALGARP